MNKYELLSKPIWSNKDIQEYFECKANKACEIRKIAVEQFNGFVFVEQRKVYRDAVLKAANIDLQHELQINESLYLRRKKNDYKTKNQEFSRN